MNNTEQHSDRTISSIGKREIPNSFFQVLEGGLMGGNSEAILSHTTHQLHFYKQLLQNFTLDRSIMVHNTTNISSKSDCG